MAHTNQKYVRKQLIYRNFRNCLLILPYLLQTNRQVNENMRSVIYIQKNILESLL